MSTNNSLIDSATVAAGRKKKKSAISSYFLVILCHDTHISSIGAPSLCLATLEDKLMNKHGCASERRRQTEECQGGSTP